MIEQFEKMSLFEQLQAGLEDSIAFSRGQISLKSTELPPPPPILSRRTIISLRQKLKMSQAVFAATLNVSHKTIQSWEQGLREPSHAAARMLQVIGEYPGIISLIFANSRTDNTGTFRRRTSRRFASGRNGRPVGSAISKKKK